MSAGACRRRKARDASGTFLLGGKELFVGRPEAILNGFSGEVSGIDDHVSDFLPFPSVGDVDGVVFGLDDGGVAVLTGFFFEHDGEIGRAHV